MVSKLYRVKENQNSTRRIAVARQMLAELVRVSDSRDVKIDELPDALMSWVTKAEAALRDCERYRKQKQKLVDRAELAEKKARRFQSELLLAVGERGEEL